jgi:hypothetical protein
MVFATFIGKVLFGKDRHSAERGSVGLPALRAMTITQLDDFAGDREADAAA